MGKVRKEIRIPLFTSNPHSCVAPSKNGNSPFKLWLVTLNK